MLGFGARKHGHRRKGVRRVLILAWAAVICGGALLFSQAVLASVPMSVMPGCLTGTGGIGSPVTGNTDTIDWNPAALGETQYKLQFSVLPASAHLITDTWNLQQVYELALGSMTAAQRQELVSLIDDGFLTMDFQLRGGAMGAVGGNGVGASLRLYVQGKLSSDLAKFILEGNTVGETMDHTGSTAETALLGDYSVTSVYSDPWLAKTLHISGFHMGATLRVLQGMEYTQAHTAGDPVAAVRQADSYAKMGSSDIIAYRSGQGWGVSLDTGIFLRLTPALAIDASLLGLGRVLWTDFRSERYSFTVDPVTGKATYVLVETQPLNITRFWDPPTTFRAGLTAASGKYVLWSLQYSRRLNGEAEGEAEWVLGTQLKRINMLPLRMSVKYTEGSNQLLFSLGLGIEIGPLAIDIGTSDLGGLLGMGKRGSIAVTTGMRF